MKSKVRSVSTWGSTIMESCSSGDVADWACLCCMTSLVPLTHDWRSSTADMKAFICWTCSSTMWMLSGIWSITYNAKTWCRSCLNHPTCISGPSTWDSEFYSPSFLNEPRHEKTCLCHMQITKAQISLHICAVWSAPWQTKAQISLHIWAVWSAPLLFIA